ncbi:MAG: AMP-binding protein [Acidimicrobiia bacterium]
MPLNTLLRRHALYRPDHTALIFDDTAITWSELDARVDRVVAALASRGLGRGDRVATMLDNGVEIIELYQAVARAGFVAVPLSPLLRGDGLVNLLVDSGARVLITMHRLVGAVDQVRDRVPSVPDDGYLLVDGEASGYRDYRQLVATAGPGRWESVPPGRDDPFDIVYSSGTTGLPKGIVHTHEIREAYATGFTASYRIHPESIILHSGSLVFNGAFLTLMPWFYLGCTFVLMPSFDPAGVVDAVDRYGVTHMLVVPSQVIALLATEGFDGGRCATLEMLCSLGAPLHLEHKQELDRRLPGRFYELYGLTEGFVTILDRDDFPRKPGSVGVPPPLYEMRIVDDEGVDLPTGEVGEIVGRGPITTPGYWNRPGLTAEAIKDGWLYSGDLGYVDDDGFLYLVDRKKDLIISGGVNVYPRDIEEVIVQHPDVVDVAVFGVDDVRWGETPIAAVRLRQGTTTDPAELREWINDRVSRFQKVREVEVRIEFPLSVAGKTLRRVLKSDYLEAHS